MASVDWYGSSSAHDHPYIRHYPADRRRLNVFLGEPGGELPRALLDQVRADLTLAPPGRRIRFTVFADPAADTRVAVSELAAGYPHAEVEWVRAPGALPAAAVPRVVTTEPAYAVIPCPLAGRRRRP